MNCFNRFHVWLLSLFILLFICSCGDNAPNDLDVSMDDSSAIQGDDGASYKSLDQLLNMDFDEMDDMDVDLLRLYTGEMDREAFEEKYGPTADTESGDAPSGSKGLVLDALSSVVWGTWEKVDIPGAVCGNNSQYKIFMMKSTGLRNRIKGYTKNLLVYLEPGGACWDYPSCTGQTGIRGAAHPDGISDNFMSFADFINPNVEGGTPNAAISPLILKNHPVDTVETADWNKVFIPYCTGDVFSGNSVKVYEDPTGENPSLEYHHVGATNMEKVIAFLKEEFPDIDKLMITGSSAGGVGTLTNYHFFRQGLNPDRSYMLNDSGPIFSATSDDDKQYRLHQKISKEWNTDYLIDKLSADFPGEDVTGDFGQIHELLAEAYPDDALGIALFTRDTNFSGYSYARFYDLDESDPDDVETVLEFWREDIDKLVGIYDSYDNLSYFIPYFRDLNESHCTIIVEFTGTEYLDTGIDVGDYVTDILNGNPVQSYREPDNPADADVTDFIMELVSRLL